ncbi:hypothetical protein OKA06_08775 [Novosphingobium sp. MW5]|nr:hypothetical protein [Novosphingobium sp. MW5]
MIKFTKMSCVQVAVIASLVISGCAEAKKKKPEPLPPPPPPAPKMVVVAWKPIPPEWAAPNTQVPPLLPDGLRQSVNRNISPSQTTWNLRSGYNVAALNCLDPKHAEILVNYRTFLKTHAKTLKAVNAKVDAEWRAKYGAGFIKVREKYMTEVYNHFAIPPTLPAFCDAALVMSREAKLIKSADLNNFAARSLPNLEIVFDDFFKRFDQYRLDMAAWETKWGKDAVPGSTVLATPTNSTM